MSVSGEVADDGGEEATSGEIEERIEDLKQDKARQKSSFTRIKNKLLRMLDEQDYPSRREIKEMCHQLSDAQERAMETMHRLSMEYALLKDREKRKKVVEEMNKLELEFLEVNEKAQEYLDAHKDELSSLETEASENTRRCRITESVAKKSTEQIRRDETRHKEKFDDYKESSRELNRHYKETFDSGGRKFTKELYEEPTLGWNMWNQLKRISIPVFNGDRRAYEGWKAAFMACVHQAPATPDYKLLQLRQHLSGEALKIVEPFGHSAAAYEAAIALLERKLGGQRRKLALHLDELENIKSLRPGNTGDIERFADLLDVTVVNLKEANRHDKLGKRTLYISLCKKLNEGMLAQYHRWIFKNHCWESVETLKEFMLQEAEFQTVASETIRGVTSSNRNVDSRRNQSEKAFFGNAQESEIQKYCPCKVCKGHHGVWYCDKFKDLPVQERWNTAKRLKLCFRCLGGGHRGHVCQD